MVTDICAYLDGLPLVRAKGKFVPENVAPISRLLLSFNLSGGA